MAILLTTAENRIATNPINSRFKIYDTSDLTLREQKRYVL